MFYLIVNYRRIGKIRKISPCYFTLKFQAGGEATRPAKQPRKRPHFFKYKKTLNDDNMVKNWEFCNSEISFAH